MKVRQLVITRAEQDNCTDNLRISLSYSKVQSPQLLSGNECISFSSLERIK